MSSFNHRRLLVVVGVPAVVWIGLLLAAEPVFWSLVFDDSFYYWQIARNLAAGAGSTFDGLNQTNGYHPLWMLFCSGLYAVGLDGDVAPRVALIVQVLLFSVAWGLLAAAVLRMLGELPAPGRRPLERAALGLLLVVACVQPLVKLWVNGLESTFVVFSQVLLLAVFLRNPDLLAPAARRDRLACGALLALTFLARTDGALLLPAIALWGLPRLWRDFRGTWRPLFELLAIPTVVVVAFMVVNQAVFGTAVQVSGQLKAPVFELWRVVAAIAVVAGPAFVARRLDRLRWARLSLVLDRTAPFGLFVLIVAAYYGALSPFPRSWYFGPVVLYVVLLGCAAMADLMALAAADPVSPRRAVWTLSSILGGVALVLMGFGFQQALAAPGAAPLLANREAGLHIAAELPADAVLASWDAGVVGYYSHRSIVSLDGVVNSSGYLAAMRNGTTADYLAGIPIGWVVNHAADEQTLRAEALAYLGPRAGGLEVVRTWPFEVFAGVNQAVPEAHSLQVFLAVLR